MIILTLSSLCTIMFLITKGEDCGDQQKSMDEWKKIKKECKNEIPLNTPGYDKKILVCVLRKRNYIQNNSVDTSTLEKELVRIIVVKSQNLLQTFINQLSQLHTFLHKLCGQLLKQEEQTPEDDSSEEDNQP